MEEILDLQVWISHGTLKQDQANKPLLYLYILKAQKDYLYV